MYARSLFPSVKDRDLACHLKAEIPVSDVEQVNVTESYRGT